MSSCGTKPRSGGGGGRQGGREAGVERGETTFGDYGPMGVKNITLKSMLDTFCVWMKETR